MVHIRWKPAARREVAVLGLKCPTAKHIASDDSEAISCVHEIGEARTHDSRRGTQAAPGAGQRSSCGSAREARAGDIVFGVQLDDVRKVAKETKSDRELGTAHWNAGIMEGGFSRFS